MITNSGESQIIIYYQDGREERIDFFETDVKQHEEFNHPRFAIPFKHGFLVLDTGNHRIIFLEKKRNIWYEREVTIQFPTTIPVINELYYPRWIEFTRDRRILITDTENCRIVECEVV